MLLSDRIELDFGRVGRTTDGGTGCYMVVLSHKITAQGHTILQSKHKTWAKQGEIDSG